MRRPRAVNVIRGVVKAVSRVQRGADSAIISRLTDHTLYVPVLLDDIVLIILILITPIS